MWVRFRSLFPTCAGPFFESLSFDSSGPGPLNLIFRSRDRSPALGNAILELFGRTQTDVDQVSPQILEPNHDSPANYAYWGGGPLALSLGCCQELRPKARLLIQNAGPSFGRLSVERLSFEMSKDSLSKDTPAQVGSLFL